MFLAKKYYADQIFLLCGPHLPTPELRKTIVFLQYELFYKTDVFYNADVDVEKPDEKSIMTYVAQFVRYFNKTDTLDDRNEIGPQVIFKLSFHKVNNIVQITINDSKIHTLYFLNVLNLIVITFN